MITATMPPTGETEEWTRQDDNVPLGKRQRRHSMSSAIDSLLLAYRSQTAPEPRPDNSRPLAVVVGGIDLKSPVSDSPGRGVHGYDERDGSWKTLTDLPDYTHHHGVCEVGGKLYLAGGAVYDSCHPEDLGTATRAARVFNPRTGSWNRLADMRSCRAYIGLVAHDGYLYAIGGEDEHRRKLDTIERYDPMLDTWTYVGRMPGGGRIGAAVAVHRGQLFIIGGYSHTNTGSCVMQDVLCLDLNTGRWIPKTPMIIPRCHACLTVAKDRLYLIGGRTKLEGCQPPVSSLSLVQVYDDLNDAWEHVGDLEVPRHDAGCTAIGSSLYVVGGMQAPNPFCLHTTEIFDVDSANWVKEEAGRQLPYPVTGAACCTLDVLESQ